MVLKISRKQALYWGTVALIVFFFIEFFWPLMYSHDENAATPTPEAAKAFTGRAIVQAKILYLSSEGFVSCNSSNSSAFLEALRSTRGVQSVFAVSETGFVLKANASNETLAVQAFNDLLALTDSTCSEGSAVLRNAGLLLEASNFSFQSLESFNDSRTLYLTDLLDAFRAVGAKDVQGFVDATHSANETIQVAVTIQMLGSRFTDKPQVEELRFTKPFAR
ncbi:MAG: hypothetical protein QW343_03285 [Candidatus Norongarragalinales archaeon]